MKKNCGIILIKLASLLIISLTAFYLFGYSHSVSGLTGDSYTYYGLVRDIWLNNSSYFDWAIGPGINLFSFRHLYLNSIGFFSYSSPQLFFSIMNLSELLLLLLSFYGFLFLVNQDQKLNLKPYLYLAPVFLLIWFMLNFYTGYSSITLLYSDLFLLLTDTYMLIILGLLINIINHTNKYHKLPFVRTIVFVLTSYYFAATNLRFAIIILNYLCLLGLLFFINIKNKEPKQKAKLKKTQQTEFIVPISKHLFPQINHKIFFMFGLLLLFLFGIGYISFFTFEQYSTSSRYFYLASGPVSDNTISIFFQSFSDLFKYATHFAGAILFAGYFISMLFGLFVWVCLFFNKKSLKFNDLINNYPISTFFSAFTVLSLVLFVILGTIQGGLYFWQWAPIRYLEISILCAYIAFSALLIERFSFLRKNSFIIAFLILVFGAFYAIYDFSKESVKTKFPYYDLYSCIQQYKTQYNLQDGIADFWVARPLNSYGNKNTQLNMHVFADNPPMVNSFWLNNLRQKINTTNFLVYTNKNRDVGRDYQNLAFSTLSAILPQAPQTVTLTCGTGDDSATIIVLDSLSANVLTKFLKQTAINARSYFVITNYGFGQTIWKHTPWRQKYIEGNHTFLYYGNMLQRLPNQSINYSVNANDLSVTANGFTPNQVPIFSSGSLHTGKGKFSTQLTYSSKDSLLLAAVNLQTGRPIKTWSLPATGGVLTSSEIGGFSLEIDTPIAIMVVASGNLSATTINTLSLSWDGF